MVAQSDILTFYDTLDVLRIVLWCVRRGLDIGTAGAILRLQMFPKICLHTGRSSSDVKNRTKGGLTGSRVAGALGRVPVESVFEKRGRFWHQWGYATEHCCL